MTNCVMYHPGSLMRVGGIPIDLVRCSPPQGSMGAVASDMYWIMFEPGPVHILEMMMPGTGPVPNGGFYVGAIHQAYGMPYALYARLDARSDLSGMSVHVTRTVRESSDGGG